MTRESRWRDVARIAANLDAMGEGLDDAYGVDSGADLRRWATSIRQGDGWGVLRFLDAGADLGRYDYPGLADGRYGALLAESSDLARKLRVELDSGETPRDIGQR